MAEERVTLFLFGTVLLFGLELTYTGTLVIPREKFKDLMVREGCKASLSCKTDTPGENPSWAVRRMDDSKPTSTFTRFTSEVAGIRYSTITIESVKAGDEGTYTCSLDGSTVSSVYVDVIPGKMDIQKMVTSSNSTRGSVQYRVETCLPDVDLQFFRGSSLLDSTKENIDKGYVGTLELRPDIHSSGEYVFQARSEIGNIIQRDSFFLSSAEDTV